VSSLPVENQIEVNDLVTFRKLKVFFETMGMELYDLSIFSTLALHISYEEFKQKYLNHFSKEKKANFYSKNSVLPIICSECPGWVCYAEKRCGELALPHMSTSKSP